MEEQVRAKALAELVTKQANVESRNKQAIKNIEGINPDYVQALRDELENQGWKVAKRKNQLIMTR